MQKHFTIQLMVVSHSARRAKNKYRQESRQKRSITPLTDSEFSDLLEDFYEFAKEKGFHRTIREAKEYGGFYMFHFQRDLADALLRSLFQQISMEINVSISRRSGKTDGMALATAYAFNNFYKIFRQPISVIVIAPEKNTASVPFKMIENYIDKTLLSDGGDTKKRKETIRGDCVELFGIYDEYKGSMIEGRDANLVIRDEAHMGDDNKYLDQIEPTLVSNRGASIFLGNGGFRNCLFKERIDRCYKEGINGKIIDEKHNFEEILIRYTYTELRDYFQKLADNGIQACKTRIDNIDKNILKAGGMASKEVRKNYFCKWMTEYGNCVTQEQLDRCHDKTILWTPQSEEDLYLGLDFATVKDRTVATIMDSRKRIIDWIVVKDANEVKQPRDQLTLLRTTCEDLGYYDNLVAIGFDSTGVGQGGVHQFLEDEFDCDLIPYYFTEKAKNDWYPKAIESIATLFDEDRLKFNPENAYSKIFEKEWIKLERRLYDNGKKGAKYSAPRKENSFDDFCASFAIVNDMLANMDETYKNLSQRKVEKKVVPCTSMDFLFRNYAPGQ